MVECKVDRRSCGLYYHVWVGERVAWHIIVDNQCKRIVHSGFPRDNVHVCIVCKDRNTFSDASRLVSSYGFKVVNSFSQDELEIYEGATLQHLFKDRFNYEYLGYIHTKGMSKVFSKSIDIHDLKMINSWRYTMESVIIDDWLQCLNELSRSECNTFGVTAFNKMHSGNFWWAKSSYISTLCNPVEFSMGGLAGGDKGDRLKYEHWIASGDWFPCSYASGMFGMDFYKNDLFDSYMEIKSRGSSSDCLFTDAGDDSLTSEWLHRVAAVNNFDYHVGEKDISGYSLVVTGRADVCARCIRNDMPFIAVNDSNNRIAELLGSLADSHMVNTVSEIDLSKPCPRPSLTRMRNNNGIK